MEVRQWVQSSQDLSHKEDKLTSFKSAAKLQSHRENDSKITEIKHVLKAFLINTA